MRVILVSQQRAVANKAVSTARSPTPGLALRGFPRAEHSKKESNSATTKSSRVRNLWTK